MSEKNNIRSACEKANHVCDKTQFKEATLWEKIKLNIHLIYCRACRSYTKNNTKLSKLCKNNSSEDMPIQVIEKMKKTISQELEKQN